MKRTILLVGVLGGIATAIALFWSRSSAPIIYARTNGAADWITYSNAEIGFELRIPQNWYFNVNPKSQNFGSGDGLDLSIDRVPLTLDNLKQESKRGRYLPGDTKWHKAIVNGVDGEQANFRLGNFDGTWPAETFALPRGASTFLVTWSVGSSQRKETAEDRALCHAVVSTFRFIEPRHADYIFYRDLKDRFSFEIPSDWLLSGSLFGEPIVSIRGSGNTWIGIYVYARTTLKEFQGQHSITSMTPKADWFAHHLSGARGHWNDHDAYILEKGNDLVVINIFQSAAPVEMMTRFFDSFNLGPL